MKENGDITRTVIEFLFTRQRQTYLAFAKSLVHDEEAAKDILSDSIASVWEHREEIQDMQAYLFTTVKNNCLRYRRDRKNNPAVYDKIAEIEQGFQDFYSRTIENSSVSKVYENEIFNILMDTLAEMPEDARTIFRMKKFEGKTYKEISSALGVSHATIDHTLRRILKRLSLALKDYGPQIAVIVASISSTLPN